MTGHLFVYGTLMRSAAGAKMGVAQRARLDADGDWLGHAQIAGQLYDRGRYPILVVGAARSETVHGELYRLHAPPLTFQWLDPYEGIPPGKMRGPEYERVVRRVQLANGEKIVAWVYAHHGPLGTARHVPDGRWRPA